MPGYARLNSDRGTAWLPNDFQLPVCASAAGRARPQYAAQHLSTRTTDDSLGQTCQWGAPYMVGPRFVQESCCTHGWHPKRCLSTLPEALAQSNARNAGMPTLGPEALYRAPSCRQLASWDPTAHSLAPQHRQQQHPMKKVIRPASRMRTPATIMIRARAATLNTSSKTAQGSMAHVASLLVNVESPLSVELKLSVAASFRSVTFSEPMVQSRFSRLRLPGARSAPSSGISSWPHREVSSVPTEAVDTMRPQSAVLATSITYWQEPANTGKEPVRVPSISVDRLSDIEERSNIPTSVRARPAMAKRMPMHRDTFWHVLLQAMVSAGPGHRQNAIQSFERLRAVFQEALSSYQACQTRQIVAELVASMC